MKPETVSLLCAPGTHEPLSLGVNSKAGDSSPEMLIGIHSGSKFSIRDGIPLLLDESKVTGFNQQYQGFYNRAAGMYDAAIRLVARLAGGGEAGYRMEYLNELVTNETQRVLEVSIGTGANLRLYPEQAAYFGLDISWGMLKRCQRNLSQWQREAELVLGNAEDLPFLDESFDTVFHVGGINAFNDPAAAISEMVRVSKKGAKILIVDETAKLMNALDWMPTVKKWLKEHGERFAAPVSLVPEGMQEIQARDIVKGNLYCLTFRKP